MPLTADLRTKVRNVSGAERSFGYLGAHGVTLADGEEYEEPGDLLAKLSASRRTARLTAALQADLDAGDLVIVETAKDHFFDVTRDETKVLKVDSGSVSVVNPSWGAYSSSIAGQ